MNSVFFVSIFLVTFGKSRINSNNSGIPCLVTDDTGKIHVTFSEYSPYPTCGIFWTY
jgi:hypothetical protein